MFYNTYNIRYSIKSPEYRSTVQTVTVIAYNIHKAIEIVSPNGLWAKNRWPSLKAGDTIDVFNINLNEEDVWACPKTY